MCNLLIAVFHGKFPDLEAVDLGEKEKLEIPGGWGGGRGVQRPSGTENPGG